MKFKDFYRESILRESRGEFWIDSSGGVESCDIDVNDTGHEGVILERLMHEYTNLFDIDYERSPREDLGRYEEEMYTPPTKVSGLLALFSYYREYVLKLVTYIKYTTYFLESQLRIYPPFIPSALPMGFLVDRR